MMNIARLEATAALLDKVPENKFDMGHWGVIKGRQEMAHKPMCASSACVLGWACTIPEIAAAGLGLYAEEGETVATVQLRNNRGKVTHSGSSAGAVVFGISEHDANRLFTQGRSMTAKEKAQQIRHYIETGELYHGY